MWCTENARAQIICVFAMWLILCGVILTQVEKVGGCFTVTEVTIYTDGACKGNPGSGGWAAILECRGVREGFICGYFRKVGLLSPI